MRPGAILPAADALLIMRPPLPWVISWRAAAWDGIHAAVEEMDCVMRLNARHALWLDERVRED